MSNKQPSIADIFSDEFIDKLSQRESAIKKNVKLSVREAIVISKHLHDAGLEPGAIFNTIAEPDIYNDFVIDSTELDYVNGDHGIIKQWQDNLFMMKLKGAKISSWRKKIASLLSDINAPVTYDRLHLAVSLPQFDSYENRYNDLANKYVVTSKRGNISAQVQTKIKLIDNWEEKNASQGRRKVYAFETVGEKRLVLWALPAAHHNSIHMFNELMQITDTFIFKGRMFYKIVSEDKYALQYASVLSKIKISK